MRDFTLSTYEALLTSLQKAKYESLTMSEYIAVQQSDQPNQSKRIMVLRHDVDLHAERSLATAQLEHRLGLKATYYFRIIPQSNNPAIIKQIVQLGHEIGYHYEDMSICNGDIKMAKAHFEQNLSYFRQYANVQTICMHGAPTSKYDGRDLWRQYDYHDYGIICEPYFDIDFSQIFYLTDTGRMWDGWNVALRDKIPVYQDKWISQGLVYHHTSDIIEAIQAEKFPTRVMITSHPQRWTNKFMPWLYELIVQHIKNIAKRILTKTSKFRDSQ